MGKDAVGYWLSSRALSTRRTFIGRVAASAAISLLGSCALFEPTRFAKDPFTLGVTSGDPLPDGVVLWTRLAPDPLTGGGMGGARLRSNGSWPATIR